VREKYQFVDHRGSRRGSLEDFNGRAPLPEMPIAHPPGSPEKLAAMIERAARGEVLFHPMDGRRDG